MVDAPSPAASTRTVASALTAVALVAAPIVFALGWATLGASIEGFSSVRSAISQIAAVDSPRRWQMFAVFVTYGLLLLAGARALRGAGAAGSGAAATVNALSVWGVAAFPIHGSERGDAVHGLFALMGYVTLALMPALAVRPLKRAGRQRAALISALLAAVMLVAFLGTAGDGRTGLYQRIGTTTGDLWMAAAGVLLLTGGSRWRRGRTPVTG